MKVLRYLKMRVFCLSKMDYKVLALIVPNAKRAIAGGGGSASLKPYYLTTPYQGFEDVSSSKLFFTQGCDSAKWLPLLSAANCGTPAG